MKGNTKGEHDFSMFPLEPILNENISESFIVNIPKTQGVGGDGYWFYERDKVMYITLFDCMGHGHLASMITRIYKNALDKVIKGANIEYAGSILQYVHREIQSKFTGREGDRQIATGADMGVVKIDFNERRMEFAGAKIDLLQMVKGKVVTTKGDRMQVGDMFEYRHQYNSIDIDLKEGPFNFYLMTDGVKNMIGGESDRKMGMLDIKMLLEMNANLDFLSQRKNITNYLKAWCGGNEPSDDVLMIGFKV